MDTIVDYTHAGGGSPVWVASGFVRRMVVRGVRGGVVSLNEDGSRLCVRLLDWEERHVC
jgi:hypothetical protein